MTLTKFLVIAGSVIWFAFVILDPFSCRRSVTYLHLPEEEPVPIR